jgi:hypothetical protein
MTSASPQQYRYVMPGFVSSATHTFDPHEILYIICRVEDLELWKL